MAVIHEQDADAVCVMGDLNAKPHSPFFDELERCCVENDLSVCDVRHLPDDSYTHFSEAHNTTSWLDHVIASDNIADSFHDFKIVYGNSTSNHFPICFNLCADLNYVSYNSLPSDKCKVKWNFSNDNLVKTFNSNLDTQLRNLDYNFCAQNNCKNDLCRNALNSFYNKMCNIVNNVGAVTFGTLGNAKGTPVPGWNELVREHHQLARDAFLAWRAAGSPREGDVAVRMRAYRAQFKLVLREWQANEERLRTEAMAQHLANHNITDYWKAVRKLSPKSNKLSNKLDDVTGENEICELWRTKCEKLFNSVDPNNSHSELLDSESYCDFITIQDITNLVKK